MDLTVDTESSKVIYHTLKQYSVGIFPADILLPYGYMHIWIYDICLSVGNAMRARPTIQSHSERLWDHSAARFKVPKCSMVIEGQVPLPK